MKIIITPDSFKGCLTAKQAALGMERGIKKAAESSGSESAVAPPMTAERESPLFSVSSTAS